MSASCRVLASCQEDGARSLRPDLVLPGGFPSRRGAPVVGASGGGTEGCRLLRK
jgi:hypothetical protein